MAGGRKHLPLEWRTEREEEAKALQSPLRGWSQWPKDFPLSLITKVPISATLGTKLLTLDLFEDNQDPTTALGNLNF